MAVIALGAPKLERSRLNFAPRYVLLRHKLVAAIRKAVAAGFSTWRLPRWYTLPPVILLSGHSPSHEAKCASVGHLFMSRPTSATMVWAIITLTPSMRVRSIPLIRYSSSRRLNRGAFRPALLPLFGVSGLLPGSVLSSIVFRCDSMA